MIVEEHRQTSPPADPYQQKETKPEHGPASKQPLEAKPTTKQQQEEEEEEIVTLSQAEDLSQSPSSTNSLPDEVRYTGISSISKNKKNKTPVRFTNCF